MREKPCRIFRDKNVIISILKLSRHIISKLNATEQRMNEPENMSEKITQNGPREKKNDENIKPRLRIMPRGRIL